MGLFSIQILAVGAEPVLTRFNMNGMVLSQIQCAPQSSFSLSLHPSGVCSFSLVRKDCAKLCLALDESCGYGVLSNFKYLLPYCTFFSGLAAHWLVGVS